MNIIVQKFGGTSVRSSETRKNAVEHVKLAVEDGFKVVVVVSAMGRKGDPYATDTLLSLVNDKEAKVSPREIDLLMSCGETISSVVFSQELNEAGLRAAALTVDLAGFLTNDEFNEAKILKMETDRLLEELE